MSFFQDEGTNPTKNSTILLSKLTLFAHKLPAPVPPPLPVLWLHTPGFHQDSLLPAWFGNNYCCRYLLITVHPFLPTTRLWQPWILTASMLTFLTPDVLSFAQPECPVDVSSRSFWPRWRAKGLLLVNTGPSSMSPLSAMTLLVLVAFPPTSLTVP